MSTKEYHGSCHCGTVRFTTKLDLTGDGTYKCNCTICLKIRSWEAMSKPEEFAITQGENALIEYRFGRTIIPHYFCKHCGVHTHLTGDIPNYGPSVLVQVNCLDDIKPQELGEATVKFLNNLVDRPFEPPEYTGHL